MEPKHVRGINSPDESQKGIIGPFFKSAEKSLYEHEACVAKHTDPRQMPSILKEKFGDRPVIETDFSSFEAHHKGRCARIVRHCYHHVLRSVKIPAVHRMLDNIFEIQNQMSTKHFDAYIDQRLMSGVMCTSSANGILDMCVMAFLYYKARQADYKDMEEAANSIFHNFPGVIEGDDGMCFDVGQDPELAARLGFKLKLSRHKSFNEASFCGNKCPANSNTLIKDPRAVVAKLTFLESKYQCLKTTKQLALVRAKALSYYYQYKDVPIVGPLCNAILTRTKDICIDPSSTELSYMDRKRIEWAMKSRVNDRHFWHQKPEITPETRLYVHEMYGISCAEQEYLEDTMLADPAFIDVRMTDHVKPLMVTHGMLYCKAEDETFIRPQPMYPTLWEMHHDETDAKPLRSRASRLRKRLKSSHENACWAP